FSLRGDLPADQPRHEHRDKGYSQDCSEKHRKRFGEGERTEQAPFLSLERKHRNETDRDDQKRKEQRSADALGRLDYDLKTFPSGWIMSMLLLEMFERLVGVLHHDNRSVDHRA